MVHEQRTMYFVNVQSFTAVYNIYQLHRSLFMDHLTFTFSDVRDEQAPTKKQYSSALRLLSRARVKCAAIQRESTRRQASNSKSIEGRTRLLRAGDERRGSSWSTSKG